MLDTLEIRWFFDRLPLDISRQFSRPDEVEQRTDWYSLPCNPLCGIKLREGKLEIKLKRDTLGERSLEPVSGHLEAWRKWSLDFASHAGPSPGELSATGWLPVHKRRRMEHYHNTGSQIASTAERPENGCELEMTELTVGARRYWTVGFESVGPADLLEHNLMRTFHHVVARGGFIESCRPENSLGYAQWLAQLEPRCFS
jgi:hypothetical protein